MKLFNRSTGPVLTVLAGLALGAAGLLGGCAGGGTDLGPSDSRSSLSGFPSDAPIPAGTMQTMNVDDDPDHWAFTVYVNDAAAQEAVVSNYVNQGYSETGRSELNGRTQISLEKGTVAVALVFQQDDQGQYVVIFNVVDRSGAAVPEVTIDPSGNVTGIAGDDASPPADDAAPASPDDPADSANPADDASTAE